MDDNVINEAYIEIYEALLKVLLEMWLSLPMIARNFWNEFIT